LLICLLLVALKEPIEALGSEKSQNEESDSRYFLAHTDRSSSNESASDSGSRRKELNHFIKYQLSDSSETNADEQSLLTSSTLVCSARASIESSMNRNREQSHSQSQSQIQSNQKEVNNNSLTVVSELYTSMVMPSQPFGKYCFGLK
jgi:hypothetical protein